MLITSISGIRGTIGGNPGENLTPVDVVNFASAYGTWIKKTHSTPTVIIGRDGRISGSMIMELVIQTLQGMGVNVVDCGTATTPTVEMMVIREQASGGIIITASHNPREYNGIKMLNSYGEFLSANDGAEIVELADSQVFEFADADNLGAYTEIVDAHDYHVAEILKLDVVDEDSIHNMGLKVVVDSINSVGGLAVPQLLDALGVEYVMINGECDGEFTHKPEPLEENLSDLKQAVLENNAHLGIAVDPDVDRLVLVSENGEMFGEEYTLVAVCDYILSKNPGTVVTNVSSTQALGDLAQQYDVLCHQSAVGEKNVVTKMREVNAVIGGEGSGGIIYPELHHGRDALVGIALILSLLSQRDIKTSELRTSYQSYEMIKRKITLTPQTDINAILTAAQEEYKDFKKITVDGLKVIFDDQSWVHLRKSNTEPIIRVFAEAQTLSLAQKRVDEFVECISNIK